MIEIENHTIVFLNQKIKKMPGKAVMPPCPAFDVSGRGQGCLYTIGLRARGLVVAWWATTSGGTA